MKLAYACSWWRPIETTWSGTSESLMNALSERQDVELERVDAQHNLVSSAVLVGIGRARGYSNWKYSRLNRQLTDAKVRRGIRRLEADAVIGIGDVETISDVPTFLYQDANFSVLRAHRELLGIHAPSLVQLPAGRLDELVDEQREAYASAAGVLSFSQWFADWLSEHDGVPREKIHVVGGGLHDLPARRDLEARGAHGTNVLFIGRDFVRKGGDLVVDAISQLRGSGSGDFKLTVVGPARWPLEIPIPDWLDFRGEVPASEVRQMWAHHDIFALPTWYEPYGLVFLEARAAGVPILGRDNYCMPELIPSSAGRLIRQGGVAAEVAEGLSAISQDSGLFESAAAGSDSMRSSGTWAGVADRTVNGIRGVVTL